MKKRVSEGSGNFCGGRWFAFGCLWGAQEMRLGGRGGLRYLSMVKIFNRQGAWERVNMIVEKRKPEAVRGGRVVDLGYAKFELQGNEPAVVQITGEKGTSLVVETENYQILFINPSPPAKLDEETRKLIEKDANAFPGMTDYMREMVTDEVEANIAMEETLPVKFLPLSLMDKDDFLLYKMKLERKAEQRYGRDEVCLFETTTAKGAAQIGEATGDRRLAFMLISSRDGWKIVGCKVTTKDNAAGDSGKLIEQIAGSFKFTMDDLSDTEEIKRAIAGAGITKRYKPTDGK